MRVTNGALPPLGGWRRRQRSCELRTERENDAEPRVTYRGLDAFRLFAFLAVFLFHVSLLECGYLGVQAFFVLSGFLITPILVEMRRQLPPGRYLLNFYGRRSLRIFPLYYAYLAALGVIAAVPFAADRIPRLETQRIGEQLVYAFTYTYDFFHASRAFRQSSLLTHFWSLAVEEQFYLVWPFIVFFATGARLRRVLLGMLVAGPVIRTVEALVVTSPMGTLFTGRLDLVVYVLPFSHVDAFAMGGYLALCGRTPSGRAVGVYAAVLILVGMVTEWLATGVTGGTGLGYGSFMGDSWKYVWGYTCFNLLFGWILLMIRDRTLVPSLVEHPALLYLGQISYGLYVYHFGVIWLLASIAGPHFPAPILWRAIHAMAAFIVTALISVTSYVCLEAPCLRLKDRYFPVARRRSVASVPQLVDRAAE